VIEGAGSAKPEVFPVCHFTKKACEYLLYSIYILAKRNKTFYLYKIYVKGQFAYSFTYIVIQIFKNINIGFYVSTYSFKHTVSKLICETKIVFEVFNYKGISCFKKYVLFKFL
jgi:hypothetical protein